MGFEIVVLGSLNLDVGVRTERHPRPGETVIGRSHYFGHGGKGANQALAAARLGARVAMIGRVGDDAHGEAMRDELAAEGVDVNAISVDDRAPTGVATIVIDDNAENAIVVSPGANGTLTPEVVESSAQLIAECDVLLAQLEVPVETVVRASELAAGRFLLNPAPAATLPRRLLERVDVLIPNRSELAALAGSDSEPDSRDATLALARSLRLHGAAVVVTLGGDGAMIVVDEEVAQVPAFVVDAVDTTGAGDAFSAALAVGLTRDHDLHQAVEIAAAAGALATTRSGAQAGLPDMEAVESLLAG